MEIPREGKRGEIEGEGERKRGRSLLEVAIRGDTGALLKLLQEDEGILNRAMTTTQCTGNNNPLHLAALYGHVEFAREIVNRKRELARELNSQGQSPLHLASARGNVGVVKEILSKDVDACFVRNEDGMIPLHVAAIKGRAEVMQELVNANITTAFVLTDRGEPILHLCANNNHFQALRELVELVVELVGDDNFVKLKDSNDNTILHQLAPKRAFEVIDFLIQKNSIDVNAVNADGSTPLDVSVEYGSWRTDWILVGAGAKRGKSSLLKGLKVKRNDNQGSWFYEVLLVVAVLMITVAFQAGINPPGGVWEANGFHNITSPKSPGTAEKTNPKGVEHFAGRSIMLSLDPIRYNCFYFPNLITFFSSLMVIVLLFSRRAFSIWLFEVPATILTFLSILAMSVAYATSIYFVSEHTHPPPESRTAHRYFGKNSHILIVIGLVMFALPTPLLITRGPTLNLFWFEVIWSLKRLVKGRRPAASVQSGFAGRP